MNADIKVAWRERGREVYGIPPTLFSNILGSNWQLASHMIIPLLNKKDRACRIPLELGSKRRTQCIVCTCNM